ncbi:MAG: hypothetical protein GY724_07285 [Actinomycetia bacterium]|nr:hypothetical protein [Actinomycetes bacterium]MCP4223157.1 hypothetical protein [Actinomycetes bacterium]
MFLETILADAVQAGEETRKPGSAIAGKWRNRLGSTMELTVDGNHRIDGTFHTGVGVPDKKPAFHVVGFAEGDAVTFCVDFGSLGSVAAWAGHHVVDGDDERLVSLWHLARPVRAHHHQADVWAALLAGGDEFLRLD